MTANPRMQALTDAGVSAWLDDLSRDRITSGGLAAMVADLCVRGVTTNPTIFQKAISAGAASYGPQLSALARQGADVDTIIRALTTDDVRDACDILEDTWSASDGMDGRVSIEVDPRLAHETAGTVEQAESLWQTVDRANALIKIPATVEGLPAIADVLARGISVNVTLIFSVDRYRSVVDAYCTGLERAAAAGHDLRTIRSVASFFVSRIDTAVDAQLATIGTADALALQGTAAIATARQVWQAHLDSLADDRWTALAGLGAHPQRPLWASTGVKNPAYDPTRYVTGLVAEGCVNTMPEATLLAVAEQGEVTGDTLTGTAAEADETWSALVATGIDPDEVFRTLEVDGVAAFIASWESLRETVAAAAKASG